MYEFILITLMVIGIGGLMFLLCLPVYLLIKEERYYQKRKHEYYDEIIKNLKDTIKLYDSMIEYEKRNEVTHMQKYSLSQRCRERNTKISRITIHCNPQFSGERMIRVLEDLHRYTSFNYLIDKDGKVDEIVPEQYGSWSTGSPENDNAAINIMCSLSHEALSDDYDVTAKTIDSPYMVETVFDTLIKLCADIVKKYGYKQLLWNPNGDYKNVPNDAMVITMHKLVNPYGRGEGCVPELVEARFGELASKVTEEINGNN